MEEAGEESPRRADATFSFSFKHLVQSYTSLPVLSPLILMKAFISVALMIVLNAISTGQRWIRILLQIGQ